MKTDHNEVSFKVLHLDERGYGANSDLTRQQWQDQCADMLLRGAGKFKLWQEHLIERDVRNKRDAIPLPASLYEWEAHRSDSIKKDRSMGWTAPSFYVMDISNRVIECDLLQGSFEKYRFRTAVLFLNVTFKGQAFFHNCIFEKEAYFLGCQFEFGAFVDCEFSEGANFEDSVFSKTAWFTGTVFKTWANFKTVDFPNAVFDRTQFTVGIFEGSNFRGHVIFSGNTVRNNNQLQTFGPMNFSGAHFFKGADFSDREFKGRTRFGVFEGRATQFDEAPRFHNCILHQDTTFSEAIFPLSATPSGGAAKAYNTLRHAMSQQQSTKEEQRFLRLELDAERAAAPPATRWVYTIYKKVANYGFSIWLPAFFLVLVPAVVASLIYGVAASRHQCPELLSNNCQFSIKLSIDIIEFSLL